MKSVKPQAPRPESHLVGIARNSGPSAPSLSPLERLRCRIKEPPSAATPSFTIPKKETASLPNVQGFHFHILTALSHSISPLTVPGSFGRFSCSRRNSTQSTNLTPFAKRLKVSRQTPPPPAAATLLSRSKSRTPSSQRAAVSSLSPAVSQPHQAPRNSSSSPIARSAPPTTPSPASLQTEPGSSPFPQEDKDKKDDGPDTEGKPSGERAATGDLDELEEFYGTKESAGGAQDVGDDKGEQSQSQSLNVKDPFGFQTQAFPKSTLGEDSC